jgi:hypothetical protein
MGWVTLRGVSILVVLETKAFYGMHGECIASALAASQNVFFHYDLKDVLGHQTYTPF